MEDIPQTAPMVAVGLGIPLVGAIFGFFRGIFKRIEAGDTKLHEKIEEVETQLREAIETATKLGTEERDRLRHESSERFALIQAQLNQTATKTDLNNLLVDLKGTMRMLLPHRGD